MRHLTKLRLIYKKSTNQFPFPHPSDHLWERVNIVRRTKCPIQVTRLLFHLHHWPFTLLSRPIDLLVCCLGQNYFVAKCIGTLGLYWVILTKKNSDPWPLTQLRHNVISLQNLMGWQEGRKCLHLVRYISLIW